MRLEILGVLAIAAFVLAMGAVNRADVETCRKAASEADCVYAIVR